MPIIPYNPLPNAVDLTGSDFSNSSGKSANTPSSPTVVTPKYDVTILKELLKAIGIVVRPGSIESNSFEINVQGWKLTAEGVIYGLNAILGGGIIGGFTIDATSLYAGGSTQALATILIDSANQIIRLGTVAGGYITIDGPNKRIRSSNYVAGVSGFSIDSTLIEAENLIARGIMRGATFQYDVISAIAGQLIVSNSDVLDIDMTALDSSTLKTKGNTTFAVNDMIHVKAVTASGIQEEYLRITNISSAPIYSVTRDLAGTFAPNENPIWKAGTTIVKEGSSDGSSAYSGGWLRLIGEGPNSPYYSVYIRTGLAYNNVTEVVRLGNLNGIGGITTDLFGIFIGDYVGNKFMRYDPTNGMIMTGTLNNALITRTFTAGEAIAAGDAVYVSDGLTGGISLGIGAGSSGVSTTWGEGEAIKKISQSFVVTSDKYVSGVVFSWGSWTAGEVVYIDLQTDNAGEPSGISLVGGTNSYSSNPGSLPLFFKIPFHCVPGTTYWIVLSTAAAVSVNNMHGNTYAGGKAMQYDGAAWTDFAGSKIDLQFDVYGLFPSGYIGRTNETIVGRYEAFIGFASEAIAMDSAGKVAISGIISGLSGLAAGGLYYLSNVYGGLTLSATVRKAGIAISDTELLITHNW